MSSKISELTTSTLGASDFVPISRSTSNYKINLLEAIQDELPVFSVSGAAKDGVTNDRVAIQTAIDDCYTAGGGIVQLEAGTYLVNPSGNSCLVIKSGVYLRGAGIYATTLLSDNSTTTSPYNIISPYLWNSTSTPYGAHEIRVSDLTLKGAQYSTSGNSGNLHNLLAFAHCPKGLVERVGFENGGAHYVEWNQCQNCWLIDCETVGNGNHGTSKFQLDPNGQAGGNSSARKTFTITNSASHASGLQTLLTVSSTSGIKAGDILSITGANETSAAAYNSSGGWIITEVVSSIQLAINMYWPTSVATPATTAGTGTVETWVQNNGIIRYKDKLPSDLTHPIPARTFLDLSHNTNLGAFRNFTIDSCHIFARVPDAAFSSSSTYNTIAFDSSAYPNRFLGLNIINNIFEGGASGQNDYINLHIPNTATYPHRFVDDINVENNIFRQVGIRHAIITGNSFSDTSARSPSSTPANEAAINVVGNVNVSKNKIRPIATNGTYVAHQRAQRVISTGTCKSLVMEENVVHFTNESPNNWYRATVSSIDTSTDQITLTAAHPWTTGQDVVFYAGSVYPSGISTSTLFVIVISSTVIKLASSYANALAGTAIDITTTGGGTQYVSSGWGYIASANYGIKIDHSQNSYIKNNLVRIDTTNQALDLYLYPFIFSVSNFELPGYSTTISNSATSSSGLRTSLTVSSSSSFKAGDKIVITSANGTNASQYNRVGGYTVTSIPSGTSIEIDLPWQGNATTAGTIAVTNRPTKAICNWVGNKVEIGPGVGVNCQRPFSELISSGTEMTSWSSTRSPSVSGIWQGNIVVNNGNPIPADTAGGAPHFNVGVTSLTTTITTASESENTLAKARHRWAYGPRYGTVNLSSGTATVSDVLITSNTHISLSRTTDGGTVGCSYSITRTAGTSFTITSKDSAGSTQSLDTSTIFYMLNEPN